MVRDEGNDDLKPHRCFEGHVLLYDATFFFFRNVREIGCTCRPLLCSDKKNGDFLVTLDFYLLKNNLFPVQIKMCCQETG